MNPPSDPTQRLGTGMVAAGWVMVLLLLALLFYRWLDSRQNPNRDLQATVSADGIAEVALRQNRQGHYLAPGQINGQAVTFLLDTGATAVAVPGQLAADLRLKKGRPLATQTAAGMVTVFSTVLDRVELGPIALTDVRATINPQMTGAEVLLGMTFLRRLELVQRDGTLTLRQHPL